MNAIVYTSNTGYTKHYAELLAGETGLQAYSMDHAKSLSRGTEIIYLGWIVGNKVIGYQKAAKKFHIKAVCAVGMGQPLDQRAGEIRGANHIKDAEVFYLQGGFDIKKLRGFYKLIMMLIVKMVRGSQGKNTEKTGEGDEIIDILLNGCDKVSVENLSDVLTWYRGLE